MPVQLWYDARCDRCGAVAPMSNQGMPKGWGYHKISVYTEPRLMENSGEQLLCAGCLKDLVEWSKPIKEVRAQADARPKD